MPFEHRLQQSKPVVFSVTMFWEIIESEAEVVDSESIFSDNVLVQLFHPGL